MKILGIIPARYASTRFPGKALYQIDGKSMIRRVYEQAKQSKILEDVIVATDDERIFHEISQIEGRVIMTADTHKNGTERCAEVAKNLNEFDYYLNIQGDEPYIHPDQIDNLCGLLDGKVELATLVKKIDHESDLDDPTEMKVIFNLKKEAIYFSRACIPYCRDYPADRLNHFDYYKHIGIYAFRSDILQAVTKLPMSSLEACESLEQLRWLENGYRIQLGITTLDSQMIDTPEDLAKLKIFE